jgi:UDP-N-acetylglucosamine diphosphorylase/glucosamine-1-phosphate N-acetyltransferase
MNYILFDDQDRNHLLPLTFLRPVAAIRCGILTIQEKWERHLKSDLSWFTSEYLRKKFPLVIKSQNVLINGAIFPDDALMQKISELNAGQALVSESKNDLIAIMAMDADIDRLSLNSNDFLTPELLQGFEMKVYHGEYFKISRPWHIFTLNDLAVRNDFKELTKGRISAPVSKTNRIAGEESIFIEHGAVVEFSVINATTGPVYIGSNAEVMENCSIRGPFALCDSSVLKMGAKIYGPTTIGPQCKVGGEVNNSVFFGFSNKAHDGFLGNSVIAEWCNLGADTNNSNLKNTYDIVKLWSYPEQHFVSTGLQFCGLIMGDHSKSSINTMFNTGTVIGISANIFGDGFPRNFIPSFSWGGAAGMKKFNFQKAIDVATAVCSRRGVNLSETDVEIFQTLYALSE